MEQQKKRKSIGDRLKSTLKPDVRAIILQNWSTNITARTDELLNLAYNAHLAGDTEALGEHLRELSRFIRQSMSAVPNITRILQGEGKKPEQNSRTADWMNPQAAKGQTMDELFFKADLERRA